MISDICPFGVTNCGGSPHHVDRHRGTGFLPIQKTKDRNDDRGKIYIDKHDAQSFTDSIWWFCPGCLEVLQTPPNIEELDIPW